MYISPREVADTRDHTLHNLLAATTACVDAGERLTNLFVRAGRSALADGSRQLGELASGGLLAAPSGFRIDGPPNRSAQMIEEAFDIVGSMQTAVVQAAEAQVRICDRLLVTAIDRAARSSPWEGAVALAFMKTTLQSIGSTLHSLAHVAIHPAVPAENPAPLAVAKPGEDGAARPPSRPARKKKAQ